MSREGHYLGQIRDFLDNRGAFYSKFATQLGSGLTHEAIGNYTAATESFILSADSGPLKLARMIVLIRDAATFDAQDYGSISGGLTNGIRMWLEDDSGTVVRDLTDPLQNVMNNVDWAGQCYDGNPQNFGAGDDFYPVRWTFEKAGAPLRLPDDWKIRIILSDSFTGLVAHRFLFQGLEL
jgi:hypothetical protein